jgi:hypothetical protein
MRLPFTFTHPLRYQVTTAHTEECAVCLRCDSFGKIGLSGTRGAIEQDTLPGLSLSSKKMRELDREDDGLFQRLLRAL